MSVSRMLLNMTAASVIALSAAAIARAVPGGGGGGGGGALPSQTGSSYNPAEEYQKGIEALQEGDFRDAERAFDRVVDAAPNYADGHYLLGVARVGGEKLRPARRAFQAALREDENHIGARAQLGVTLARLGEGEDAREQLDVLQERAATCAQSCADAGALAEAVATVEAAIAAGPQAALETPAPLLRLTSAEAGDAAYVEAVSLINEGRYDEAIAALQASRQAFGPHPDVLTYLGYANRKLGRYEEAERYYYAALEAAPEHRGAIEYLGELRVEQGNLPDAQRLLDRLDRLCTFGCYEADELRRWIDKAK